MTEGMPDPRTHAGMLLLNARLKWDGPMLDGVLEALTGEHMSETGLGTPIYANPRYKGGPVRGRSDPINLEQNLLLVMRLVRTGQHVMALHATTGLLPGLLGAAEKDLDRG